MRTLALTAAALAATALAWPAASWSAEPARRVPPPRVDVMASPTTKYETAVFAGGCFWGVQGIFQRVKGVNNAVSGYTGGDAKTARYDRVGSGRTGHAESVRITYDPQQISYGKLLQIYFSVAHDPTELNRQGPDTGPQYRSTVFAENIEQAHVAQAYIAQLNQARIFGKPLATTIEMSKPFYAAEAYHQDFLTRYPRHGYIVIHDMPKIENLKKLFPESYRSTPVLVNPAKGG